MCFLALMMSEIITAPIIVSGHFCLHHSRRISLYRKRGAAPRGTASVNLGNDIGVTAVARA
jgi:hypothetical protein